MKIKLKKFFLIQTIFFCVPFHSFCQNWDVNLLRDINQTYTSSGGNTMTFFSASVTPFSIITPLSILGYAFILKDKQQAYNGLMIASSEIFSSLITTSMKLGFKRERPFNTYQNDIIKYSAAGSYSFPSGHTSAAFNLATALTINYPKWYVYIPAYIWASSVGYSRMYLGVHYPSDVLIGAITGSGTAILTHYVRKYLSKNKISQNESRF